MVCGEVGSFVPGYRMCGGIACGERQTAPARTQHSHAPLQTFLLLLATTTITRPLLFPTHPQVNFSAPLSPFQAFCIALALIHHAQHVRNAAQLASGGSMGEGMG